MFCVEACSPGDFENRSMGYWDKKTPLLASIIVYSRPIPTPSDTRKGTALIHLVVCLRCLLSTADDWPPATSALDIIAVTR
jgi:hypothetical protein